MKELWDIYDEQRNKLNVCKERGSKLNDNEYHLVCNAWIKNKEGKFLISQRSADKSFAYMWECTGGSVLKDETTLDAACREIKEELGIDIDRSTAKFVGSIARHFEGCPDYLDVWIFEDDTLKENFILQVEELNDAMWATKEEIMQMKKEGKFEANAFFEEALNY